MENIEITVKKLQLTLVHAAYGRAMLAANSLESKLCMYLMCHATEGNYAIPKSLKRMPLGALAKEFVAKYAPGDEIEEELDNMVFFRNELAHRIQETIVHATRDMSWQERVIEELGTIESYFSDTEALLQTYEDRVYSALKVSKGTLQHIAERIYPGICVNS